MMDRARERVAPHEALDLGGKPEIGGTEARQCLIKIDEAGDIRLHAEGTRHVELTTLGFRTAGQFIDKQLVGVHSFCQTQRGLIAGLFLGFSAQFIHPLLGGIVGVGLAALPVTCLVVAWGLVDYAPWARTYAIIVSAIWLLDFPLGTVLSIYTLWVLLPESSESEYRQLAMQ